MVEKCPWRVRKGGKNGGMEREGLGLETYSAVSVKGGIRQCPFQAWVTKDSIAVG